MAGLRTTDFILENSSAWAKANLHFLNYCNIVEGKSYGTGTDHDTLVTTRHFCKRLSLCRLWLQHR